MTSFEGRARAAVRLRTDARDARSRRADGDGWLFEVKWDGYRAIATMRSGEVDLGSRNGNSLNDRFPTVESALARPCARRIASWTARSCAIGDDGRATFSAMQQGKHGTTLCLRRLRRARGGGRAARRAAADDAARAAGSARRPAAGRSSALGGVRRRGGAATRPRAEQRFEGIIAKRADSSTSPAGASRNWLKLKTHGRQEFVIAGYTKGQGRRSGRFGSLVLAVSEGGGLR